MSDGGCMSGAKPPRVNPNVRPARAVLPTHTVFVGAGDDATASSHLSMAPVVVIALCCLVTIAAILFLSFFGSWMVPVISIDGVSATALDAAARNSTSTMSPSFDVDVRVKMRRFHLTSEAYARGSVAVSCAGGAVTARGKLPDVLLYVTSPSVASAWRSEVRLDVSVVYRRSEDDPGSMLSNGFRALCAATESLGHWNSTATPAAAACTVVKQ